MAWLAPSNVGERRDQGVQVLTWTLRADWTNRASLQQPDGAAMALFGTLTLATESQTRQAKTDQCKGGRLRNRSLRSELSTLSIHGQR